MDVSLSHGVYAGDIQAAVTQLLNEGRIYWTIDNYHYQIAGIGFEKCLPKLPSAVLHFIKINGGEFYCTHFMFYFCSMKCIELTRRHYLANADSGVHVNGVISSVSPQGYSTSDIMKAITNLSNEGLIYSTIDDFNYQYAGADWWCAVHNAVLRLLKTNDGELFFA